MINKADRNKKRAKRQVRVRNKIFGTANRPRLNVYRSINNIYAQLIDDEKGITLITASTLSSELKGQGVGGNKDGAKAVGELIAKKALSKGIETVVFDRAGYLYHGRIKQLADSARETGLKF